MFNELSTGAKRVLIAGALIPILIGTQSTNIGEGILIGLGIYAGIVLVSVWIYSGFNK